MRILLLSDLHIEFADYAPPEVDVDVVVLAGDINLGSAGVDWAMDVFPAVPVVYVLGNHEYYRHSFDRLAIQLAHRAEGTNVHVLERGSVEIKGVRFLGCTLWTDFSLFGDASNALKTIAEDMSDYVVIRAGLEAQRKLTPDDTLGCHLRSRKWLRSELTRYKYQKCVVVTHHAPSSRSLALIDRFDPLSTAYASPMDEFVAASGASLWVHGHVHESVDYMIGGTRVVANARGYPRHYSRSNLDFDPLRILEV